MDVKELFESIVNYRYKLEALAEELKEARHSLESVKAVPLKERVQTSSQIDVSELLAQLEQYRFKILQAQIDLIKRKNKAFEILNYETDNLNYAILLKWYFQGKSWDEIAHELGERDRSALSERKNKAVEQLNTTKTYKNLHRVCDIM